MRGEINKQYCIGDCSVEIFGAESDSVLRTCVQVEDEEGACRGSGRRPPGAQRRSGGCWGGRRESLRWLRAVGFPFAKSATAPHVIRRSHVHGAVGLGFRSNTTGSLRVQTATYFLESRHGDTTASLAVGLRQRHSAHTSSRFAPLVTEVRRQFRQRVIRVWLRPVRLDTIITINTVRSVKGSPQQHGFLGGAVRTYRMESDSAAGHVHHVPSHLPPGQHDPCTVRR